MIGPGESDPREAFAEEPWFELACQFVDEWDTQSFDPEFDSEPLEHFEPGYLAFREISELRDAIEHPV